MTDLAHYYFIPTVREGLAAYISSVPAAGIERTEVHALLTVNIGGQPEPTIDTTTCDNNPYCKRVALYGPGDVLGFDASVVTRTDPRKNVHDFEPNFLAMIELSEPDLPWRFTPAGATDPVSGKLIPWLTLIVLKADEYGSLGEQLPPQDQHNAIPIRWVKGAKIAALPDLDYTWMWAHVQVTGVDGLEIVPPDDGSGTTPVAPLVNEIAADPDETESHVVARLICPRRLAPKTNYTAFVVPTFKLGLKAAGFVTFETTDLATALAWNKSVLTTDAAAATDLPYYYKWDFATSVKGDFEYLVRLLKPRELTELGTRRMDCADLAYDLAPCPSDAAIPQSDPEVLHLEGALISPDLCPAKWVNDPLPPPEQVAFQEKLASVINTPATVVQEGSGYAAPPVVPPVFGRRHSGNSTVNRAALSNWQNDLNLDPRQRAAAGFGAYVVQKQQEPLMAAVWDQLGKIEAANQTIANAQLGLGASKGMFDRLERLPMADFLWTTAPVFPRVRTQIAATSPVTTISKYLSGTSIPGAAFDHGFRRLLRGRGGIRKKQKPLPPFRAGQDILSRLNSGDIAAADVPPALKGIPSMCGVTETTLATLRERLKLPNRLPGKVRIRGRVIDRKTQRPIAKARVAVGVRAPRPAFLGRETSGSKGGFVIDVPESQIHSWLVDGSPEVYFQVTLDNVVLSGTSHSFSKVTKPKTEFVVLVQTDLSRVLPNTPHAEDFCEEAITCDAVRAAMRQSGDQLRLQKNAAEAICEALTDWLVPETTPTPVTANLTAVYNAVKGAIAPSVTIPARVKKRLRLGPKIRQRGDLGRIESEIDIDEPMYEHLAAISQDLILPGVETVPQNTLAVLKANRRFIEAYMLSINDSLASECLFRSAPVYLWSTFCRSFWDVRGLVEPDDDPELTKDITRLTTWRDTSQLGHHDPRNTSSGPPPDQAVLLIRGDLLKRYPNTLIYAVKAGRTSEDEIRPLLNEYFPATVSADDEVRVWPIFSGSMSPDLSFLGFNITPYDLCKGTKDNGTPGDGYFIIIEERLGEPRFGFDVPTDETVPQDAPRAANDWYLDINWGNLQPPGSITYKPFNENSYIDERVAQGPTNQGPAWGASSAAVANIALQRPVRVSVHASKMLSETACTPPTAGGPCK